MTTTDIQILDKIKSGNIKYTSYISDFKKTVHDDMMMEDVVSSGKFYYGKKTAQMAMEYTNPAGDLMIVNGENLMMRAAGKERKATVKQSPKMKGIKTILFAAIDGNARPMEATKISCKTTDNSYVVTAVVDNKLNKSGMTKVVMTYDKTSMLLTKLVTYEMSGIYETYDLKNIKSNQPIKSELFK
jgi:outer membrane lipoprotein-sorting protein